MRLEKIVLDGFKSFADKTEFNFDQQITAIVGPNGCGKSNVVDALKWVLGEQSTKSLRSGMMADVIFSGSAVRKPMGMSDVSLHFSQASSLGIEGNELVITRRLYRSGESEYLINNKTCRMRDIRELFMDTGVGVRSYSILEQGQIAQLLTASKVDRRIIFEEAAGISKYKAQKKEALNKLERTEQNLLRLADIVGEVQKQLRSIKLQAGKARNYLQYSQKLKELRVNFSLAQYHQIKTESDIKNKSLIEIQNQFAQAAAEVADKDTKLSKLAGQIIEKENEINRCDNTLVSITSKIEQQQQHIEFLHKKIEELENRNSTELQHSEKLNQQLAEFEKQLKQCQNDSERIEKIIADKQKQLENVQQHIKEINISCGEIENELEDEKSGIIDIVRRTAQLHNEIQSTTVYRNNLHGQKDRLSGKVSQSQQQLEELLGQRAENQARLDDINKVISELQGQLEEKREQIKTISEDAAQTNDKIAGAREQRSANQSETAILTEMENKQQGVDKAVREILNLNKPYVRGIVADIIKAEPKYAAAIEAALEGKTDALIVSDTDLLINDKELLNQTQGRVKFIRTDKIEPLCDPAPIELCQNQKQIDSKGAEQKDISLETAQNNRYGVNCQNFENLKRAVEFVSFEPQYAPLAWHLLGKTIIVESIEKAIELAQFCTQGYSFATTTGEILNLDGSISTGPIGKALGLISRKSRLVQLKQELDEICANIKSLEEKLDGDTRQNEHLEKLCKEFRTSVYEANTEKTNVTSDLNAVEQNIKRLTDEQPILAGEIQQLEKAISETVQNEYASKQQLSELEAVNSQRSERIEQLEKELAEKKQTLDAATGELTELKVALGQSEEQKKALAQQITSLDNQIQNGRTSLISAQNSIKSGDEQIKQSQEIIQNLETEITRLFREKETTSEQSIALHQQVEQMLKEQTEIGEALKIKRQEQSRLDEQIHQLKLELSQFEVKSADLVQRVLEELQMDLAAAYQNYKTEEINWDAVRDEIADLRGKIERLGNVNVDAIEQQDELEKRNDFLTSQIEDLNKSKEQLQQLISRLNKESIDKFAIVFEQIRTNFQEVFRKLFGGGKADIMLEQPEDILESGIEIMAKPPGKETRSISLLSGGEKTMTAIALLFAIFKTKPSPFCFLDEVDAALDEANNERFNLIVQEFKKHSQFVIITHAKRTMSIADVLFGITMQQKGVSKKISVKFDTYEPQAEIEATAVA